MKAGCWRQRAGAAGRAGPVLLAWAEALGRSLAGWAAGVGEREGERWAEGEGAGPERREGFLSFFLTENLNSFVNQIPNYFQTIF